MCLSTRSSTLLHISSSLSIAIVILIVIHTSAHPTSYHVRPTHGHCLYGVRTLYISRFLSPGQNSRCRPSTTRLGMFFVSFLRQGFCAAGTGTFNGLSIVQHIFRLHLRFSAVFVQYVSGTSFIQRTVALFRLAVAMIV